MKRWVTFTVAVGLLLLFAALTSVDFTGGLWHELLGIGILLPIAFHLFLQGKSKLAALHKHRNWRCMLHLVNAWLLLAGFLALLISGILTSRYILRFIVALDVPLWERVHLVSAWFVLVLLGIHLGLHLHPLVNTCKRILQSRAAALLVCFCVAAGGIVLSVRGDLGKRLAYQGSFASGAEAAYSKKTEASYTAQSGELSPAPSETLEDFLSRLICNSCPKHCTLLNPGCGKGTKQLIAASNQYVGSATGTGAGATPTGGFPVDALAFTSAIGVGTYGVLLLCRKKKTEEPN